MILKSLLKKDIVKRVNKMGRKKVEMNKNQFDKLNARIKNVAGFSKKIDNFEKKFVQFQIDLKMIKRNQNLIFKLFEKK